MAWVTGEAPPTELTSSENSSSYIIVIIITVSASACLLIAATIIFATVKSKKKAQRTGKYNIYHVFFLSFIFLGPNKEENLPDVLLEKGDFPMNYIYTLAATSVIIFIVNVFIMLWYIVRKRNKARKFNDLWYLARTHSNLEDCTNTLETNSAFDYGRLRRWV